MRYFIYPMLLLIAGCTPQSYFKTPNDVYKQKVILYLRAREGQPGTLTVPFESHFNTDLNNVRTLQFVPEGKTEAENIPVADVIGYSIDKNYYAIKKLDLFLNNTSYLLFVKRLTGEDSRIQLYELYETGKGNVTGEIKYSYFISLPSFDRYETINSGSVKLIPDFDIKMSELVSDCPGLARKIKERQKGYFIPVVSFNTFKRRDVLSKIIEEYNGCK